MADVVKVAAVADVHIGNHRRFGGGLDAGVNARCRHALDALSDALALAVRERCGALFVAGDLFDYARPEAQVIAATQSVINTARALSGGALNVVLVRGNHESHTAVLGDHALGPLAPVADVVDVPTNYRIGGAEVGCIPFQPGSAISWLPAAVERAFDGKRKAQGLRVLVMHLGIADEKTAPWLREARDAVHVSYLQDLCKRWQVGLVLAGNWHDRREWTLCGGRTRVQQIGTVCPVGFKDPGLVGYGGVAVAATDGSSFEMHEVGGPRFVKLTRNQRKQLKEAQAYGAGPVYVEMTAPADALSVAAAELRGMVEATALEDAVVLPDAQEVAVAARNAAGAARSADTLYEALGEYVQEMPLEDGVDRDAVLAGSRRYLARAKAGGAK